MRTLQRGTCEKAVRTLQRGTCESTELVRTLQRGTLVRTSEDPSKGNMREGCDKSTERNM